MTRAIVVTTNDPARPRRGLTLRAKVVGSVIVLPQASVAIGTARPRRPEGRVLVRRDPSDPDGELRVSDVTTSQPWLEAEARRVERAEPAADGLPPAAPGDWVLQVSMGSAPWGTTRERVRFRTGLGREPEYELPVIVTSYPPVVLQPDKLSLAAPEPGGTTKGTVLAMVRRGRGEQTLESDIAPYPFRVDLEQTGARHYKAVVSWTDSGPDTPREATLLISVGDDTVEVPVSVAR